ncbi:MAG TPA: hypothetical protein VIH90_08405 [Candidatus Saccharimonadales bacterium]
MIVVEIGSGKSPGPFFDGADPHFIVDRDRDALTESAERHPEFTPMFGSDATRLDLPDSSVDIVLARNVFGDPALGIDKRTLGMVYGLQTLMVDDYDTSGLAELNGGLDSTQYSYKQRIAREASRVLIGGGKFIVIEQYTPPVAEAFFHRLATDPDGVPELSFATLPIVDITPITYSRQHTTFYSDTAIVGIKMNT